MRLQLTKKHYWVVRILCPEVPLLIVKGSHANNYCSSSSCNCATIKIGDRRRYM
jgi:hypothetical protein